MNSRWQASKIGLVNFWYYDEQEFPFVKGRMLLRGSNGSGKSVTMQSVIPLLLDGNMSPERLDPFGSRDRKMISYLLDDDDPREERTGYLYLELKREDSDTYLTIGMGIRARKGKPLDKWYFGLSDGRRVGKDFYLYRELADKVTLSRKELENRIGDGGSVFDRQQDYMDYVNRHIFGFDNLDDYKEMIDLLIQLRTPKLSRDFKPSVIGDILTSSLQPLSDEDLRPMSEAIENMDTMNMNLKNRQEAKTAAEKIQRELGKYNSLMLYKKAKSAADADSEFEQRSAEKSEHLRQLQEKEEENRITHQQKLDLDARKSALEKEQESLAGSDVLTLKKRENDLERMVKDDQQKMSEKDLQLTEKKDRRISLEQKFQEEQNRVETQEEDIHALLEQMDASAEEFSFEEHRFFRDDLEKNIKEPIHEKTHEQMLQKTKNALAEGYGLMQQVDLEQRRMDVHLSDRDKKQAEKDSLERRVWELEALKTQTIGEWQEHFFQWNSGNQELILSSENSRKLAESVQGYEEGFDFNRIRDIVAQVRTDKMSLLLQEQKQQEQERNILLDRRKQIEQALEEWENHKEPVPERSDAVVRNRQRLHEKNIPFIELYKVLEFGEDLNAKDCNLLEEALSLMGLLDALVIDASYQEEVLKLDPGCCDKYLFQGKERAENSLLDLLDINDAVNNILFNQQITGILEAIAYESTEKSEDSSNKEENAVSGPLQSTSICAKGHYQLGILTGTLTGEYEAGFLGTQARERNRQNKIEECRRQLEELCVSVEHLDEAIAELKRRLGVLEEEYLRFPNDADLRASQNMLTEKILEVDRAGREIERLEKEIRAMREQLDEKQKQALQIAQKLYLTCSLDAFRDGVSAADDYSHSFYRLISVHQMYLQSRVRLLDFEENIEDVDRDMDDIRRDQSRIDRNLRQNQEELASIREQLSLTDYEQIRERLNQCMAWLSRYPAQNDAYVSLLAKNEQMIDSLKEELSKDEQRIEESSRLKNHTQKCFCAEQKLGYVELPQEDMTPASVSRFLNSYAHTSETDALSSLNQAYHENRGALSEYQLMQTELFSDLDQDLASESEETVINYPAAKRYDIVARYQGKEITFQRLLVHLTEDIAQLQELIKDGDRELFEDILANTISRKIRGRIHASNRWVENMNQLMNAMNTSSGLRLSLRWRAKVADVENQLDTQELVDLLKKDYRLMREEEAARLSMHFRSKVEQARRNVQDGQGSLSFYQVMKDTLDYRQWFEFQLFSQKEGERQKELTNSVFGTFSGGEKAMSMYVPLFSAVTAKYDGGSKDAPHLIALDEAFAGVDNRNIRDMFRLMSEFRFNFIINSQVLWGDCDTLDALAIYQLVRPSNAHFVTVMSYLWNGRLREVLESEEQLELRAAELN